MADELRRPSKAKLQVTFGLREAIILAVVGCAIASAAVYFHVR